MTVAFTKYQGAGNDFILIDNRHSLYPPFDADRIRRLCDRQMGIGADGILFIEMSEIADYKMRIFNADGSEPAMCGNGMRCVFDFLAKENRLLSKLAFKEKCDAFSKDTVFCESTYSNDIGDSQKNVSLEKARIFTEMESRKKSNGSEELHIECAGRIFFCCKNGDKIRVNLGTPSLVHWPIELSLRKGWVQAYVLDTGVPHAVLFVEDILELPFSSLGEEMRWHRAFEPSGVNVNCATVASDGSIQMRTYERGVEKETLACGTGAAATAWVAKYVYGLNDPIIVKTRAALGSDAFQESMQFVFPIHCNGEKQIEMLGTAHRVFTGLIDL